MTSAIRSCSTWRRGWAFLALAAWPVAAPAQVVLLSDIVGDGDGSGNADPNVVGIDPDTGDFQTAHFYDTIANTGNALEPVADNPAIDSVFIITAQTMPINTNGVTFQFPAGDVSSSTWNWILKDATHDIDRGFADIWCGGIDSFSSGIGIHSSAGITFDLQSIRTRHGASNVRQLSCFAGRDQCGAAGDLINLHAIVSNASQVLGSVSRTAVGGNQGAFLELAIPDNALYLTLASGASNGGAIGCDHGVFAEAVLSAQLIRSGVRTVSVPVDPDACPPGTGGPASVNIRREGAGAGAVTVTERIFGPSGPSDVTAQNGGQVSSIIPGASDTKTGSGFIRSWLLLGPFSRTGGPAPGEAAMRLDYLTDGGAIQEAGVQPTNGDTVQTAFGGAAASTGLAVFTGGINPGGIPTWAQWLDTDDTIQFDDYYGGDVNDIVMVAVCYLRVASGMNADFCVGSDDSVQILLDGSEIHINNIGRGAGASEACNDTIAGVTLGAGVHRLMVKVFDGSGGHAMRLGIFDAGTTNAATGVDVCLDPFVQDPCPLDPAGVEITWNPTRTQLASPGVGYSIAPPAGNLRFRGTIEQRTTLGPSRLAVSPSPVDRGPIGGFDHAHEIGLPCAGTAFSSAAPGAVTIAGAGGDIWQGGDQFLFAYGSVTGDFSARVTIADRDFAPGSRWGKHGLMARQDCGTRSRYSFIHDQGEDLQDTTRMANRPTHGGADNFEITPAVAPPDNHADTLRLDRCGNEFIALVLDEAGSFGGAPGEWVEVGRHEWAVDPPDTVEVGLAVTSHAGCAITTIAFEDWQLFAGCDAPVGDLACVADGIGGVRLTWVNPPGSNPGVGIEIEVDDVLVATVPGTSTSATIPPGELPAGRVSSIEVINSSRVASRCSYPLEVDPAGFIQTWLILGPLNQPGGAAPGEAQMARDYLTDGVTTEENVEPAAGRSIRPDYGDMAASTGLAATPGRPDINPGGVPAWFEWDEPDDVIDYGDVFNADLNNVMCYAATYITVAADTTVDIGCDSDDAIQILIDGIQVHLNNIARGLQAPGTVVDTVTGVHLTAGRHLIVVKVFEGAEGHGFRLRFQDGSVPPVPVVPGRICSDPTACSPSAGPLFLRGDVNSNGRVSIADGEHLLDFLARGEPGLACPDAADADGNGRLDVSDAVAIFGFATAGAPMAGGFFPICENATSGQCIYLVSPCRGVPFRSEEPRFRLELDVERLVEQGVTPNPVEATVRLRNTEPGELPVRAWSLGIRARPDPDCRITSATTQGTAGESASFRRTELVAGPEGAGAVSSVILAIDSFAALPSNEAPHTLLRLALRGPFVPGECMPCILEINDELRTGGRVIRNLIDSDFQPFSRPVEVAFCTPIMPLAPGGAPATFSLPAASPGRLFKLAPRPAPGRVITLDLEGDDPGDRTALYARWGAEPTPARFDHAAADRGRSSQRLVIPFARDETCFVLVHGSVARGGAVEATLRAAHAAIVLESVSADCAEEGCDGIIHLAARGGGFDETASFSLERPGTSLPPLDAVIVSVERADLAFDVSVLPPGRYDLVVRKGGPAPVTARLAGAVRVERRRIGPRLEVSIDAPNFYRPFQVYTMNIRYANTGDEEMRAPLFEVAGRAIPRDGNMEAVSLGVAEELGLPPQELPDFTLESIQKADVSVGPLQVLGIHLEGDAGRLPAGASGSIPVTFFHPAPFSQMSGPGEWLELTVRLAGAPLTWTQLGRPSGLTDQQWSNLRAAISSEHVADYQETLSRIATRLGRRGARPWRVRDIVRFAALETRDRDAAIIGTVLGPGGAPLPARVVGARRGGAVVSCATTDGRGSFELGPLADGQYDLVVEGHVIPPTTRTISGGDVFAGILEADVEDGSSLFCPRPMQETGLPTSAPGIPRSLLTEEGAVRLEPAVAIDPNVKDGPDDGIQESDKPLTYTIEFHNIDTETSANRIVLIDALPEALDPDVFYQVVGVEVVGHYLNVQDGGEGGGRVLTDRVERQFEVVLDYPAELAPVGVLADFQSTVVKTTEELERITGVLCGVLPQDPTCGPPDVDTRPVCSCPIQEELQAIAGAVEMGKPHLIFVIEGKKLLWSTTPISGDAAIQAGVLPPDGIGTVTYRIEMREGTMDGEPIENSARIIFDTAGGMETMPPTSHNARVPFLRGDTDDNGRIDLTDAIRILNCLFTDTTQCPACEDTADVNDEDAVTITDAIALLNSLFNDGDRYPPPRPPYPDCGFDPTPDLLPCAFDPDRCKRTP